jgi:transposase, IS6 family
LSSNHNQIPRVITVDKNPAYPPAIDKLKNDKILPKNVGVRQIKYLNNIIEQDHRSIKRIVNPMLGFQSFQSANKTLKGIEAMNMRDFLLFSGLQFFSFHQNSKILILLI